MDKNLESKISNLNNLKNDIENKKSNLDVMRREYQNLSAMIQNVESNLERQKSQVMASSAIEIKKDAQKDFTDADRLRDLVEKNNARLFRLRQDANFSKTIASEVKERHMTRNFSVNSGYSRNYSNTYGNDQKFRKLEEEKNMLQRQLEEYEKMLAIQERKNNQYSSNSYDNNRDRYDEIRMLRLEIEKERAERENEARKHSQELTRVLDVLLKKI